MRFRCTRRILRVYTSIKYKSIFHGVLGPRRRHDNLPSTVWGQKKKKKLCHIIRNHHNGVNTIQWNNSHSPQRLIHNHIVRTTDVEYDFEKPDAMPHSHVVFLSWKDGDRVLQTRTTMQIFFQQEKLWAVSFNITAIQPIKQI